MCRAVAALAAAVLIAVGWLGAHHRAEVAHVHDGAGSFVHADALAEHHSAEAGAAAHLHGRADHQHTPGACTLLATLLARTPTAPAVAVISDATILPAALPALAAVPPALAAYRLAPKTSPPTTRA